MRLKKPGHATVIAYLALFFAMGGTAVAATGGTFLLGKANYATSTTSLSNSAGSALALYPKAGTAPIVTNSTTRVTNLNADRLDGLDQASFQRRVTGTCTAGRYARAISATGAVTCETATAKIIEVDDLIDTSGEFVGQGVVACPGGYAIVGGGYDLTDDEGAPLGVAVAAWAYPESTSIGGENVYRVKLISPEGGDYTGGGIVFGTCVLGSGVAAPAAALRTTDKASLKAR
jgi:hypothetical protein